MNPWIADSILALVSLFWGLTFVVVKDALNVVGVFTFLWQRFALAFVTLIPVLVWRGHRPDRGCSHRGILLGLFLFGSYALQTLGLKFTSASHSAFITGLNVIAVPFLGLFFFRHTIRLQTWFGVMLAGGGLFFLTGWGSSRMNPGDVLTLGCALCVAMQILLTGRFAQTEDPYWLAAIELGTVAILSLLCGILLGEDVFRFEPSIFWALVLCALLASNLAFVAQTVMQRYTSAMRTAVIFCLEPVFGSFFAFLLAGERLRWMGAVGAVLILAGMLLVEWKFKPKAYVS